MIKECAAKYSITLRTEEEEIKYRNTLYLTCPKHLGRMHVHTGDAAPELSPGTAVLLLWEQKMYMKKNLKSELKLLRKF